MLVVIWIVALLLAGVCGYWIMDRVDRFLNEHIKGEAETDESQEDEPG